MSLKEPIRTHAPLSAVPRHSTHVHAAAGACATRSRAHEGPKAEGRCVYGDQTLAATRPRLHAEERAGELLKLPQGGGHGKAQPRKWAHTSRSQGADSSVPFLFLYVPPRAAWDEGDVCVRVSGVCVRPCPPTFTRRDTPC